MYPNGWERSLVGLWLFELKRQIRFATYAFEMMQKTVRELTDEWTRLEAEWRAAAEESNVADKEAAFIDQRNRWAHGDVGRRAKARYENEEIVFFYAHAFVSHVANISKILWAGSSRASVSQRLREELQISDSSVLRGRKLRNHLEHYEERLEVLAHVDDGVGFNDMVLAKPVRGARVEAHRSYDPKTTTFFFRQEGHELSEVMSAVKELDGTLREYSKKWTRSYVPK